MRRTVSPISLVLIVSASLLASGPARADAIDGNWCHADGRSLSIKGPQLTTPGGKQIEGDYDRHGFAYVVPAFEPEAGATITMVLISETEMRLISPAHPDQLWRRCGKPIS
jgi:hypothetical protein